MGNFCCSTDVKIGKQMFSNSSDHIVIDGFLFHELPDDLSQLEGSLRKLTITDCDFLLELPSFLGDFNSLEEIEIIRCQNLRFQSSTRLPSTLRKLVLKKNVSMRDLPLCLSLYKRFSELYLEEQNALTQAIAKMQRARVANGHSEVTVTPQF